MRKWGLIPLVLVALATFGLRVPGVKAATGVLHGSASQQSVVVNTFSWKGQVWDLSPNTAAAVDGNGNAVITRTSGSSDSYIHVNRVAPLDGNGESLINQFGTPWVLVSYLDNGQSRGVDFFVDSEVQPLDPRLQAGSLFGCQGLGSLRYGPSNESIAFSQGCDNVHPAPGNIRAAGQAHTIYVGERADGTIDYRYDGIWFTSTFLKTHTGNFLYHDVYLRLRGNNGATATFTDFQAGSNHQAPAPAPPVVTVTFPPPNGPNGFFTTSPVTGSVAADDSANGGNVTGISCTGATVGAITGLGTPNASASLTVSGDGVHNVTCTASNSEGLSGAAPGSQNTATVKIDTSAPTFSCSASPALLVPANGTLRSVTVTLNASDLGSGVDHFVLTSVTSSQPITQSDTPGFVAGTTYPGNTTAVNGQIRATIGPGGHGRTYVINFTAYDQIGNQRNCAARIEVRTH